MALAPHFFCGAPTSAAQRCTTIQFINNSSKNENIEYRIQLLTFMYVKPEPLYEPLYLPKELTKEKQGIIFNTNLGSEDVKLALLPDVTSPATDESTAIIPLSLLLLRWWPGAGRASPLLSTGESGAGAISGGGSRG